MAMDAATRGSLEILESAQGGRAGSLIGAVDRCVTGAGSRLLAEDLSAPLLDAGAIEARLALVQFWRDRPIERAQLRDNLRAIPDLGRALGRVVAGRGSPRDLGQLRDGLTEAARLHHWLAGAPDSPALLSAVTARLTGHGALTDHLARANTGIENVGDYNDMVFTISAIPAPASALLFGVGVAALGMRHRREKTA